MKINIRKAKISDVDVCYKLTKTPEFVFPGGRDFVKKYLADFVRKGIFFVAEGKGKVVGFISAQVTLGRELWVDILVVDKKKQGYGIGTILLRKLLKEAKRRKMKLVFLDVLSTNKKTIDFYKKIGMNRGRKFVRFIKEFR
jgi:ribosomal protein S18 acetylase RimI-like enzyme